MVPQGIADLPPLAEEGSVKLRAGHPPAKAVGLIGCRRQGGDLITKQAPFFSLLGKKNGAFLRFFYIRQAAGRCCTATAEATAGRGRRAGAWDAVRR